MHTCIYCGQACYCDMEDHESPQPADCPHSCDDDDDLDDDLLDRYPLDLHDQ